MMAGGGAYRGRVWGQMTITCCRLGPNALNASTASSWRKSKAPWKGREHGAGSGNSTSTPQQVNDSEGLRGEEGELRPSLALMVASGAVEAGAEKEERRELENDAAMRSIFERLRDQRDATGVPPLLVGDE